MRGDTTTEPICLDSSYLVALFDPQDTWHATASGIHDLLRRRHALTVAPDCVIDEVLTVFARRCRERGESHTFSALADRLGKAIPETAITWLYPHAPRWFAECVALMREAGGAVTFHNALLCVAAAEAGYRAIISFDTGLDRAGGLRRVGSTDAAEEWLTQTS